MGLNAPKRKEQKKQKFVSSSMKKTKEMAETVLKICQPATNRLNNTNGFAVLEISAELPLWNPYFQETVGQNLLWYNKIP